MMTYRVMDYILMMGADQVKHWQISPGMVTGRVVKQLQHLRTRWKSARGIDPQPPVLRVLEYLRTLEIHAVVWARPELGASVLKERGRVPHPIPLWEWDVRLAQRYSGEDVVCG